MKNLTKEIGKTTIIGAIRGTSAVLSAVVTLGVLNGVNKVFENVKNKKEKDHKLFSKRHK